VVLVLEYAGKGDLFQEIKRRRGIISERSTVAIVAALVETLAVLHAQGIIHRVSSECLLFLNFSIVFFFLKSLAAN
jgi:serine/threonine protein kinase